jgi:hypothetical protein
VHEAEVIAAKITQEDEDLQLGLGGVGKEGGLGSERSTEPEREDTQAGGAHREGEGKSSC